MSRVTKTFTYKVPDDYTLQEADNDSSASFTYHGPKYLHVHLTKDGYFKDANETTLDEWNEVENNIHDHSHDDCLLINALAQPLEASIFWQMRDSDIADLNQRVKTGPDGLEYKYPWPIPPHKSYEASLMKYNAELLAWQKPYPWHRNWLTWNDIQNQAEGTIAQINAWLDENDSDGADPDLIAAWTQCKTEAENKVDAYSTAGLLPHETTFRLTPADSDDLAAHDPNPSEDSA